MVTVHKYIPSHTRLILLGSYMSLFPHLKSLFLDRALDFGDKPWGFRRPIPPDD